MKQVFFSAAQKPNKHRELPSHGTAGRTFKYKSMPTQMDNNLPKKRRNNRQRNNNATLSNLLRINAALEQTKGSPLTYQEVSQMVKTKDYGKYA